MSEDTFKKNRNASGQYAEGGSQQTQSGQIVDTAEILSKLVTEKYTTSEPFSIGSTGAGTITLTYAPIMTSDGDRVAYFGDTSLSFSSILTTEVVWDETYRTDQSGLSAGEWACDYDTGFVAFNAGSTGSVTASYTVRKLYTASTSSSGSSTNISGDVAHDATDSGNPVKIGGYAADPTSLPTAVSAGDRTNATYSLQGEVLAYLSRYIEGEQAGQGVMNVRVEGDSQYLVTTDTLVTSSSGVLNHVVFMQNDAAPTAGSIDIYDNTVGSGNKLVSITFTTNNFGIYFVPIALPYSTGLYVDFTTTADVNVLLSYKDTV